MIVRTWRGWTDRSRAESYLAYLQATGLPAYSGTPGNRAVLVLRRDAEGDRAEFLLLSIWDSMDAVRVFAGEDPDRAVFYPEDDDFLVAREYEVGHFELAWHEVRSLDPDLQTDRGDGPAHSSATEGTTA